MRSLRLFPRPAAYALVSLLAAAAPSADAQTSPASDKVPITTTSEDARQLYLKGRDLAEKLRATDAHAFYEQAIAKDPNFALGYLGLATTSATTKEFIDATTHAARLAGQVSEGERHVVLGLEAAMKGSAPEVLTHSTVLGRL